MEDILIIGQFFADCFTMLWNAVGTWGVIGLGIIAPVIIKQAGNLLKKILQH